MHPAESRGSRSGEWGKPGRRRQLPAVLLAAGIAITAAGCSSGTDRAADSTEATTSTAAPSTTRVDVPRFLADVEGDLELVENMTGQRWVDRDTKTVYMESDDCMATEELTRYRAEERGVPIAPSLLDVAVGGDIGDGDGWRVECHEVAIPTTFVPEN